MVIDSPEKLYEYVSLRISQRRLGHCMRVKACIERIIGQYGEGGSIMRHGSLDAPCFLGLMHDSSREDSFESVLETCRKAGFELNSYELANPVLNHGYVASYKAGLYCPDVPISWCKAIECHTLGSMDMGYLGAALYCADYLEEGRPFLTQDQRASFFREAQDLHQLFEKVFYARLEHSRSKYNTASPNQLAIEAALARGERLWPSQG
jgi:HD superfamily phosphohydrolase YqeK